MLINEPSPVAVVRDKVHSLIWSLMSFIGPILVAMAACVALIVTQVLGGDQTWFWTRLGTLVAGALILSVGFALFIDMAIHPTAVHEQIYPYEPVPVFQERPGPDASKGEDWDSWLRRGVRIGRWVKAGTYGGPIWLRVKGSNPFCAGEMGHGKSEFQRTYMKELIPAIRAGACEVVAFFDPKMGLEGSLAAKVQIGNDKTLIDPQNVYYGKDVGYPDPTPDDPYRWVGKSYEETFLEPLEYHVQQMRERGEAMRGHSAEHVATPDDPHRVIIIDEAAQMCRPHVHPKIRNRIIGAIETLGYQGRACGYTLVVCTQYPTMRQVPFRPALTDGVCLKVKSPEAVDMVLGAGSRAAGAMADRLPRNQPNSLEPYRFSGLCYVSGWRHALGRLCHTGIWRDPGTRGGEPMPVYDEPEFLDWGQPELDETAPDNVFPIYPDRAA